MKKIVILLGVLVVLVAAGFGVHEVSSSQKKRIKNDCCWVTRLGLSNLATYC